MEGRTERVSGVGDRQFSSALCPYTRSLQRARLRDGILFFPPRRRDYFILPVSKRGPGTAKGERFASSTNKETRQSGESRARPCGRERIGKGKEERKGSSRAVCE